MSLILRQIAIVASLLLVPTYLPQYESASAAAEPTAKPPNIKTITAWNSNSLTATTTRFTDSETTTTTRFTDSEITTTIRFTDSEITTSSPQVIDTHQLSELRRLLDIHRGLLIRRHGSQEFYNLHVHLEDLVDKPLRYACDILHRLLVGQFNLKVKQSRELGRGERVTDLLDLMSGAEDDLLKRIENTKSFPSWPRWARGTPELRSAECPDQDCFKIGRTTIDLYALHLPYLLLKGILEVKDYAYTGSGRIPALNLALERVEDNLLWWYAQFKLLFTKEILTTAFIITFLAFLLYFVLSNYFSEEARVWGATERDFPIQ
ncbi:hypothetical protein GQX73_g4131 [Xylaria multiplex]|uniref:Uncharacterized protein n=1 Tax=Xylaria multiplex TaxID=323545 RepID=A0A7C8MU09_9PEZI|nr:hypothetical protein GQX73_g4131 [Xylaria multiplex]